jgi:ferric-dicitrate binding protein FerR (iron transport regulator)
MELLTEQVRWRLKALGLGAIVLAFTAVDGVFGAQDMVQLLRGIVEHRPVITSSHYAGTALLLAPMGLGLGLMALFAKKATPEQMKKAAESRSPWGRRILIFIAGSLVAAFAAPIVQYIAVDAIASGRGYASCPTPDWPRHQPDRWARPRAACPGNGADPNQ